MLPLKGNWKDSPLSLQPPEYTYEIVNGVVSKKLGAITNESGTIEHSSEYNSLNYVQNGWFNAKYGDKIIFSIGQDGLSKIGIVKSSGQYIEKVSAALGFSQDYPIDCEHYYNFKGELIVAFTDYFNTPKLINLDTITLPINMNDIQLFSYFTQPQTVSSVNDSGGSLKSGAYFPFFAYKNDDTSTPYTAIENPVFITKSSLSEGFDKYEGIKAGTITSKSIGLSISNIDTNYDKIIIGFISKIDGVLEARIIKELVISGSTIDATYNGSETTTLINLSEVLTSSSVFERIKHLTQVNGVLYGAGVSEVAPVKFQKWANLIRLKWQAELKDVSTLAESYKINDQNNIEKGFWHEEVYAFYVKLKLKGRGFSEAFLISGRPPVSGETARYIDAGRAGPQRDININARIFQIDDTSSPDGTFGYWENEDEFYPFTDDYASVNGSEDLRGKKVRHHRFPCIRARKAAISDPLYGLTKLETLSVVVDHFPPLPPELEDIVEGYELFYAKRSANNSTVNAQSTVLFNHTNVRENTDTRIFWGGGNWNTSVREDPIANVFNPHFRMNPSIARFNSFDLMFDKTAINPSYLSVQFEMSTPVHVVTNMPGVLGSVALWCDYSTNPGSTTTAITNEDKMFVKMNSFRYLPANSNPGNYVNIIGEEAATAMLESTSLETPESNLLLSTYFQLNDIGLVAERTYLANLMSYRTNIYNSFESQLLVSTGKYIKITDTDKTVYGGDCNISLYSFLTFSPRDIRHINDPGGTSSGAGDAPDRAVKVLRGYLLESNNNASLRHEEDGDETTKYYPKQNVGIDSAWFIGMSRIINPNKIAYNKDYTSINDLNPSNVFSTKNQFIAEDPYKIVRSKVPNNEERQISWKTFLANDYYIIPRDKGFITNIQGAGKELFINCEFALLKTQGSEELATDTFKVVLGTGNIFDRPPIELILEKDGYAGCQHKFSCLLTRYGYFFVDEDRKKVFIANSDSVKDITPGLSNFFRDNMKTTGDNPYRNKGYSSAWDDEFKRIILTSKEAGFTRSFTTEARSEINELGSWTSKHTYFPTIMLGDRNSLYALNGGKIHKHNIKEVRGIYYGGTIQPFIIVIVKRDPQNQITVTNITWRTNFILDDVNVKDKTFSSVLLWNSYQTSGEVNLVLYDRTSSLESNFDNTNTRRVKNEWNFNKIHNCLKQGNLKFINDIDLVPNTTDTNQEYYMKKLLSDDYVAVKLLFSNQKIGNLQAEIQLLDFDINTNNVTR